jgi:hypothetical protein
MCFIRSNVFHLLIRPFPRMSTPFSSTQVPPSLQAMLSVCTGNPSGLTCPQQRHVLGPTSPPSLSETYLTVYIGQYGATCWGYAEARETEGGYRIEENAVGNTYSTHERVIAY